MTPSLGMHISLKEWAHQTCRAAEVCRVAECDSASELAQKLAPLVRLTPGFDGEVRLDATRKVGEVQVGRLLVSVAPAVSAAALLDLLGWIVGANLHLLNDPMGIESSFFQGATLRKALAAGIVLEVRRVVQGQLHRDYVRKQERLMTLRGRPDFTRHGISPPAQGIHCQYIELTRDTPPNRVLCAALRSACELLVGTHFDAEARALHQLFSQLVGESRAVAVSDVQRAREVLGHRYQSYEPSLLLARILLFGGGPVSVVGQGGMSGWWVDMPSLFERAVAEGVSRWAMRVGLYAALQPRHKSGILDAYHRPYKETRPDIMVYDGSRTNVLAVVDAKYKPYFRAKDHHSGEPLRQVDREDLFQLAMYMGIAPNARHMVVCPVDPEEAVISERYASLYLHEQKLELVGLNLGMLPYTRELALW